jgi:hypothetical protein
VEGAKSDEDSVTMSHPFKRGALVFEDFNYAQYNPYILVENGVNAAKLKEGY